MWVDKERILTKGMRQLDTRHNGFLQICVQRCVNAKMRPVKTTPRIGMGNEGEW
jgi:hypothetical protein